MKNNNKSFLDHCKSKEADKTKQFKDALLFAFSEATSETSIDFVNSCKNFFDKNGYLTQKQVESLFSMGNEDYNYDATWDNF